MSITILNTLPSVSLAIGTSYFWQIVATGPSLQYQWYKDGAVIVGETTDRLDFPSLQVLDTGSYYVRVYNTTDSVNSNTATMEIQVFPVIITQPQNTVVQAGTTAIFEVIATGNGLIYTWKFNGVNISGGPVAPSISIHNVSDSDVGTYSVLVENLAGSVLSDGATLGILTPSIVQQPVSFKQMVGTNGEFNVISSSVNYDSYQWYKNGVAIPGANGNSLSLNPLKMGDTGSYYVKVYNSSGFVNSNTVTADVYDTPRVQDALDGFYEVGLNGQVRLCASFYGGCFHDYQWQKDGSDIPGETGLCLTLANIRYDQAGQYRLCATNPAGTVCTSTTVYVNPVPQTCFPFETPAGGLAGGGNLASGLTDMKVGRAQECYVQRVLPRARADTCCVTAGPQISPYVGGSTSSAYLQKIMEQQYLCNISTNIAVAKLRQSVQPCPVVNNGVDMRFVKYQRRGPIAEPAPPPPGVIIPNNPAVPKAVDGYCVQIIGISQSRF